MLKLHLGCGKRDFGNDWVGIDGVKIDVFSGAKNSIDKIDWIYTEYCDDQLYEGEIGLKQIGETLNNFTLIEDYGGGTLFKNG
jgi:hypothetical protein